MKLFQACPTQSKYYLQQRLPYHFSLVCLSKLQDFTWLVNALSGPKSCLKPHTHGVWLGIAK